MKRCGKPVIAHRADRVVRPYRTFYVFAENACNFAIASCAGGAEPLPYGILEHTALFYANFAFFPPKLIPRKDLLFHRFMYNVR